MDIISYQIFYPTDYPGGNSSAENNKNYFEVKSGIYLPPGEYRVVAGNIVRMIKGTPENNKGATNEAYKNGSDSDP